MRLTCVDVSEPSLTEARERIASAGSTLPELRQADVCALPYPDTAFEHAFLCFVLEHLSRPETALAEIRCVLRPGGTLTGDANIGRRLHPLLHAVGFANVRVEPRPVCVDATRPGQPEAFTLRTFTAMVGAVRDRAVAAGLAGVSAFDAGLAALRRSAEPDGTFCYTVFKAVAVKPPPSPL